MMFMETVTCPLGLKRYVCTSMTVPMEMARASTPLAPLRRTWPSPAPQSSDLVRLGKVEKQPRYRENGGQTSNLYRLRK